MSTAKPAIAPGPATASVTTFVHAGVVVEDLETVVGFLTELGFRCGDPMTVHGDWVDRIVGLRDMRVEAVMVRTPDGTDALELVKFHAPAAEPDRQPAPPNRLGVRHLAFQVNDLRGLVDRMAKAGWDLVGEVVDYEGIFLLCYLRGPEGLIFELAEPLRRASAA
jgi:catechol 2,3-dioxygenase-like lactoylglutathione lyase family enzyme